MSAPLSSRRPLCRFRFGPYGDRAGCCDAMEPEQTEELGSLRQEVQLLRQRVAELQGHSDLIKERALERRLQASLELLDEAQRSAQMGSWVLDLASGKTEWSAGLY